MGVGGGVGGVGGVKGVEPGGGWRQRGRKWGEREWTGYGGRVLVR